jgi:hypothetical protein
MVDEETNQQTRRTSNPLYPALTAPPLQSYNAGCEANNDGIFLSVFQFWSTFPNSMLLEALRSTNIVTTYALAILNLPAAMPEVDVARCLNLDAVGHETEPFS